MGLMRVVLLCIALCLAIDSASAQESIEAFDVDILAEQNGDLIITESITVNVEGKQIRRGIFRELPRYQLYQGKEIPVRYDVQSVGRNNEKEPFVIEKDGNAFVLRIGNPDYFLKHKSHTYKIRYEIKDELRRFDGYDEIYWNVTGNYWRLPIEKVSASVKVPDGVQFQGVDFFTGALGQIGKDATFNRKSDLYEFAATKPLSRGEGLTISLRFDKGVFGDVQESTKRYVWWLRNGALILLSLSFLAISAYYYLTWNRVGRDPVKGPVFAHYEPPKGYSPAAASYIYYRSVKGHKALVATLLGLATKNWISIETNKKKTVLTPLDRETSEVEDDSNVFELTRETFAALLSGDKKRLKENGLEAYMDDDDVDLPDDTDEERGKLTKEETYLFGRLFPNSLLSPITLKKEVNTHFNLGHAAFQRNLRRDYGEPYYKVNLGYIIGGVAISVIAFITSMSVMSKLTPVWIMALFAALIAMNILFIFLMPAPTKKGQKTRTEIQGFRLFMKTAEKQKFDAVEVGSKAPPPMSVARYEALLPYAVALGVEEPWSKYFETVMPIESENYQPHWGGSVRDFGGIGQMTDNMVSNISSGVSSAAPQSSSSGGGGGGFSGGGGGGGGGGGW